MLDQTIKSLQEQLQVIQQNRQPNAALHAKANDKDIIALIDDRIEKKLATGIKSDLTSLSALIEGHLEKDEIAWLMQPEVSSSLGAFLSSVNGHEYVRLFITEFREYYENRP